MAQYKLQVVNTSSLGEGPHWDAEKQELLYVDILNQYVHRYNPTTGEHCQVKIGKKSQIILLNFLAVQLFRIFGLS